MAFRDQHGENSLVLTREGDALHELGVALPVSNDDLVEDRPDDGEGVGELHMQLQAVRLCFNPKATWATYKGGE